VAGNGLLMVMCAISLVSSSVEDGDEDVGELASDTKSNSTISIEGTSCDSLDNMRLYLLIGSGLVGVDTAVDRLGSFTNDNVRDVDGSNEALGYIFFRDEFMIGVS
jgi:hypothetical protein